MKVGDLVKFRRHGNPDGGPVGLLIEKDMTPENKTINIIWFCEHTPDGWWGTNLFEVVDESRR